ncbi:MAG TPA: polyribonucleotide nucleotidyltransferase [Anaerolineae bacterium]|nr:polyribonucleotide nucleotidyltransferase [Anaerolineae bacterium]HOQ97484.1 polyribonucleotide nucleotidyltransferase [Anaerolineae bacterium]
MLHSYTASLGETPVTIETGRLAGQAGGAVTVRCGDTLVLATATAASEPRAPRGEGGGGGDEFVPLTVDYEERLYAAGRIPGGFFKREGRPTEAAILLCRLTDRPLRPLMPKGLDREVQVIMTALSADQDHYLDILSIIAASAAMTISDIPFAGPVGAMRVGYVDGNFIFNPTAGQMEDSILDLRLAGTAEAINMVEAGASEVSEELMLEALVRGHEAMQDVIRIQREMQAEIGKPKWEVAPPTSDPAVLEAVRGKVGCCLNDILGKIVGKKEREQAIASVRDQVIAELQETFDPGAVAAAFAEHLRDEMRRMILEQSVRADGRDLRTIRPITCEVGLLPRTHGSGLFTRGETQVLSIATLGTAADEQRLDGLQTQETKRFMHHYNFPPYSTGEARPSRGPRRREIGHGALAETALRPTVPSEEVFPYTIRVVSEVMSSNGSTSMGSVCASTLALMDAGVPIRGPVAGVAMGLIKSDSRYAILTDIMGMEDHLGDMDFKVAGTANGITALQMDIKVKGISREILREALDHAREGRLFILDKMLQVIAEPRPELAPYAPRITMIHIDPAKIGTVIGPGGKMIRKIVEESGARIDVEDDGTVCIAATEGAGSDRAAQMIRELVEEPEIGKIYTGKVVRTTDFGAFVQILPNKDGLVHISQLADYRVPSVEDVVHVGDEIMVMVIDIDPDGKVKLSRQAVLEGWSADEARERDARSRGPRREGGRPSAGGRPERRGGGGGERGRRDGGRPERPGRG